MELVERRATGCWEQLNNYVRVRFSRSSGEGDTE